MSIRYNKSGEQYSDDNGNPLSGGKLNFYEVGTTTRKNTYTTSAESVANANPVVLDAFGRCPDIWFTGTAKIVVTDSDDNEIDTTDPIGETTAGSEWSAYSASTTYDAGEIVIASNGRYYRSISGSNLNNEPSASATVWEEIRMYSIYNANVTYIAQDIVVYSNALYESLVGSNTGNTPDTSPTQWRPLGGDLWHDLTPKTATFTAAIGRHYLIDTSSTAFTMNMPAGVEGGKIGFTDYGESFGTNNLTIDSSGSEEILNSTANHTVNITGLMAVMIYTSARGWIYT